MRTTTMIFAALALAVAAPAVSQAQTAAPPAASVQQQPRGFRGARSFRHRQRKVRRMRMNRRQRIRNRRFSRRRGFRRI